MQEKETVLEIIGGVLDVYNGKSVTVVEKEVEVAVEETVAETKEETPKTEPITEDKEPTTETKVDEPEVEVKEEKVKEEPVVEETPQLSMEEMVATAIANALKPYQDEISTLKEENKGLNDNKAFGLQGRPTKVDEIDQDAFTVENVYENSKR